MGANGRIPTTVTRSISFRFDTLAALDAKVRELRGDRSAFVNGVMEHVLGIMAHPEMVGRTMPFVEDRKREWERVARKIEREATAGSGTGAIGLIRRPKVYGRAR